MLEGEERPDADGEGDLEGVFDGKREGERDAGDLRNSRTFCAPYAPQTKP